MLPERKIRIRRITIAMQNEEPRTISLSVKDANQELSCVGTSNTA
jgi:hypothetical protein